jgi:carbon-monoxide dehydrogenase medium subunit
LDEKKYIAPASIKEALNILSKKNGRTTIIAGGTDLIPRMRSQDIKPGKIVDLRSLALDYIKVEGDYICLGACVTHDGIVESELLSKYCPALVEAASEIADPPIRNRGTVGGNLVNASPAADLAPPLLIYDASVFLIKKGLERVVPLMEFFIGPGETILADGELLTEIHIPVISSNTAAKYIKLGNRNAMSISVVTTAVRLTMDPKGRISQARIALGAVSSKPIRAEKAEETLKGKLPSSDLFIEVGQIAGSECSPISDIRASAEYRRKMISVLTKRALEIVWNEIRKEV